MLGAVMATLRRASLRCWSHGVANAAPLLGWYTPLNMVMGRIKLETIPLTLALAVREFGGGLPSLPAHFAI